MHKPRLQCKSHPTCLPLIPSNRYTRSQPPSKDPRAQELRPQDRGHCRSHFQSPTGLLQKTLNRRQGFYTPANGKAGRSPIAQAPHYLLYRSNPRTASVTLPVTKPGTKTPFFGTGERAGGRRNPASLRHEEVGSARGSLRP